MALLRSIPGADVIEVDAGCCGMAGSFGFEAEHYELSMSIGELRLFPAIRAEAEETIIAATGVSCRQQIAHGTGRPGPASAGDHPGGTAGSVANAVILSYDRHLWSAPGVFTGELGAYLVVDLLERRARAGAGGTVGLSEPQQEGGGASGSQWDGAV